jgi:phosphoribosylformylglycinamidine synthase
VTPLFSESNTRFVCEVPADKAAEFSRLLSGIPHAEIGEVREGGKLEIIGIGGKPCLLADVAHLKSIWQKPLDW